MSTRLRIDPTPEQGVALLQIAGCCRLVYNTALEQRRDFWRQHQRIEGRGFHWMGQKREIPAMKEAAPFLADAPAHCLQMALQDLQRAFDGFFAGRTGYPRPRKKYQDDSFRFPDPAQIRIEARAGLLILPKFGRSEGDNGALRVRVHRPIRGIVRSVTITREGAHWYAAIQLKIRCKAPKTFEPTADDVIGVDRGVTVPFMGSEGTARGHVIAASKGSGAEKRLRRLQQALARAKRASKRRARLRLKLAANRAREARRRKDMIEKVTTEIANSHRVVVIENLVVRAMTASARGTVEDPGRNVAAKSGLNGAIPDKGWGMFRVRLKQKLIARGGILLVVPAAYSSQTCACCDHVSADSRPMRDLFQCRVCGREAHADVNAALVIKSRGLALLGRAPSGAEIALRGRDCRDSPWSPLHQHGDCPAIAGTEAEREK